ncbi:unnamed protein product [Chilo suppressalis]|uniref:THAP-type domain-containing protein n=1 Tax=Chilo suppressalis TaxID=168631 RepID=A0ABN8AUM1_CHISP|nr:unnamed protein product [Chilo suppressalis]
MRVTCAICKKQPVPFDRTRSFHRFPGKADLRQKWMDTIGVSSVKKTWAVCSDHFATTSFHEQTVYNNSKRRLLPNAVPNYISMLLSDITNVNVRDGKKECEEPETLYIQCKSTCPDEVNSMKRKCNMFDFDSTIASTVEVPEEGSVTFIGSVDDASWSSLERLEGESVLSSGSANGESVNKSSAIGEIQLTSIEKPDFSKTHCSTIIEQAIAVSDISQTAERSAISNVKRKCLDSDERITRMRKIRFKDGQAIRCISRADFVSNESWIKFLKYITSNENKIRANRKKLLRRERKIASFKELVNKLKDGEHLSVAQYLQLNAHTKKSIDRTYHKLNLAIYKPTYIGTDTILVDYEDMTSRKRKHMEFEEEEEIKVKENKQNLYEKEHVKLQKGEHVPSIPMGEERHINLKEGEDTIIKEEVYVKLEQGDHMQLDEEGQIRLEEGGHIQLEEQGHIQCKYRKRLNVEEEERIIIEVDRPIKLEEEQQIQFEEEEHVHSEEEGDTIIKEEDYITIDEEVPVNF